RSMGQSVCLLVSVQQRARRVRSAQPWCGRHAGRQWSRRGYRFRRVTGMAAFTYEAVGLNGRRSRGIYHADSPDQAAERLEASGLTLLEMTEARFDPRTGRGFVPGEAALL